MYSRVLMMTSRERGREQPALQEARLAYLMN
jgi:hypothetical protein